MNTQWAVSRHSMFYKSDSSNVRAAATGIQRVAMAALMMVLAVGGLAMFAGRAEAQKKPSLYIVMEELHAEASRKCGITKLADDLFRPVLLAHVPSPSGSTLK